jgi:anti-sigma regulatory factor (Ser/Thr protein kinase)
MTQGLIPAVPADPPSQLALTLPGALRYVRAATGLVEQAGEAFGFPDADSKAMSLAVEEVLAFVARQSATPGSVRLSCHDARFCLRVVIQADLASLPSRALNVTTKARPEDEASLDELGLLIAARSVDRFRFQSDASGRTSLHLTRNRSYPPYEASPAPLRRAPGPCAVRQPGSDEVRRMATALVSAGPVDRLPPPFRHPARVMDMLASGEFGAAVGVDGQGELGGAILWQGLGGRMVECFGPYVFGPEAPADLAGGLVDFCVGLVGRTPAVALLNRFPSAPLPTEYFEELGCRRVLRDGRVERVAVYFRQTHEDPGCRVWGPPAVRPFLEAAYARLALPRDLAPCPELGEVKPACSVLACEFDRDHGEAWLRPVSPGSDESRNVEEHVRMLRAEGVRNLLVEVDLAHAWQAGFVAPLVAAGFAPVYVLPYAGDGDTLVLQNMVDTVDRTP